LLDAVLLIVGQPLRVDDDTGLTAEARRLFATALREARLRYGRETDQGELTQRVFAEMLGIRGERPEERYGLYERAEREPPLWILAAIRRVTGYSLDALIAQLPAGRPLKLAAPTKPRRRRQPPPERTGADPPDPFREGGRVKENRVSRPPLTLVAPRLPCP
jgi:hypothetical protein